MTARSALLSLLSVGVLTTGANAQQYYYQPAPDYYRNDTAEGTVVGGGLGAITGAIIGGRSNSGEGALIGAGIGAITGRLLGKAKDQSDRQQAAYGAALTSQANAQAAQLAVTNYDLIQMTRSGLSDDVIIGTVRNRGGRFDLSPSGLIALKEAGVSDRVLVAAQSYTAADGATPPSVVTSGPAPTVLVSPPPVVVRRPPTVRVHFGSPRGYHYRRHHHFYHRW